MGGLYKKLPVIFWTFLIASASLAALPLISAGFYSKDLILWETFASSSGSTTLWFLGFIGAFITALYTARMVFVTFFGPTGIEPTQRPGLAIAIPLVILALFSFAGGFIELPHTMGHIQLFSGVIHQSLPQVELRQVSENSELILQIITGLTSLLAVAAAYVLFVQKSSWTAGIKKSTLGSLLHRFWNGGWGFDTAYDALLVRPVVNLSQINKNDFMDHISLGLAKIMVIFNKLLVYTQNGKLRWYMAAITLGAILTLTISILL